MSSSKIGEWTLYALAGTVLVLLIYGYAYLTVYRPESFVGAREVVRLLPMFINSIFVFGVLTNWFRLEWRRMRFWLLLVAGAILHVGACFALRSYLLALPLLAYVFLDMSELTIMKIALGRCLADRRADHA